MLLLPGHAIFLVGQFREKRFKVSIGLYLIYLKSASRHSLTYNDGRSSLMLSDKPSKKQLEEGCCDELPVKLFDVIV